MTYSTLQTFLDECNILYRDLLRSSDVLYTPIRYTEKIIGYPLDIKKTPKGIEFNIAVCGIEKDQVEINVDDGILSILYKKPEKKTPDVEYLYKGITEKSFNFSFKLDPKLNTNEIYANMDKGLLVISIPYFVEKVKKIVEIA